MKYISKSKVRNIGPNSNLLRAYKAQFTNLTSYQYEALIGHLLGDANIYTRNNGKTHGIKFEWGEKSKDYIFHVYDIFGDFILKEPHLYSRLNKNGNLQKTWRMETYQDVIFNDIGSLFLLNNKKKIIRSNLIINHLTPISLAYWYMDDGGRNYYKGKRSLTDHSLTLNTQGFTVEEVKMLIKELNLKYEFNTTLSFNKKKPTIYIPDHNYDLFFNLINPWIIDHFRYKLPKLNK